MCVNEFIRQLLELQALECSVLDIKKQREMCVLSLEALRKRAQDAEIALKTSETSLATQKCSYQAEELELQRLENLLVQQKAKQALVKKPEEFNTLEEANKRCEQQISDLQDQMLADLESLETLEKRIQTQKEEHKAQVSQWEKQISELKQKDSTLEMQLGKAQQQQQAYEVHLKGTYYQAYVNLRKCGKPMPRVVPVKNEGKCGGCFLSLSRETLDCLQKDNVPFCEHCGRILYKLEDYD